MGLIPRKFPIILDGKRFASDLTSVWEDFPQTYGQLFGFILSLIDFLRKQLFCLKSRIQESERTCHFVHTMKAKRTTRIKLFLLVSEFFSMNTAFA